MVEISSHSQTPEPKRDLRREFPVPLSSVEFSLSNPLEKSKLEFIKVASNQFITKFPEVERAAIDNVFETVFEVIRPENREIFLCDTLPKIIERSQIKPCFTGDELLSHLRAFAFPGLFDITLPILLEKLPSNYLSRIIGCLYSIKNSVGEAVDEVLNTTFPSIFRLQQDFSFKDLNTFTRMCRDTGIATPNIYTVLEGQISVPLYAFFTWVEAKFDVNQFPKSSYKFCGELVGLFTTLSIDEVIKLFQNGNKTWNCWGEKEQQQISEKLIKLLGKISGLRNVQKFTEILDYFAIDGEQAHLILKGSEKIIGRGNSDLVLRYLNCITHFERFLNRDLQALAEYFAYTTCRNREEVATDLLAKLIDLFGVARTGQHLRFLRNIICSYNTNQIVLLKQELLEYSRESFEGRCSKILYGIKQDNTLLNDILLRVLVGGAEVFNQWPMSSVQFYKRLNSRRQSEKHMALALPLYPRNFNIEVAPPGVLMYAKPDQVINRDFIQGRKNIFLSKERQQKALDSFRNKVGKPHGTAAETVFPLLLDASKKFSEDSKQFKSLVKASFSLLAPACGVRLAYLPDHKLPTDDECYDFLESLRLLIDDAIPVVLTRYDMERKYIDKMKAILALPEINSELKKFNSTPPSESITVELVFLKAELDEFYDQSAETCILKKCKSDIDKPYFQPMRVMIPGCLDVIGCYYLVVMPVEGKESIIMAGGGVRRSFLKSVDIIKFNRAITNELEQIARHYDCGGVYQAVGYDEKNKKCVDEGRVGQTERFRRSLLSEHSLVIRLPEEEWVDFPSGYDKGPIKYLVKLNV